MYINMNVHAFTLYAHTHTHGYEYTMIQKGEYLSSMTYKKWIVTCEKESWHTQDRVDKCIVHEYEGTLNIMSQICKIASHARERMSFVTSNNDGLYQNECICHKC